MWKYHKQVPNKTPHNPNRIKVITTKSMEQNTIRVVGWFLLGSIFGSPLCLDFTVWLYHTCPFFVSFPTLPGPRAPGNGPGAP